ncbi:MAG: hypothetical protein FJ288_08005, partial [Planctomycetes bacterium]|nr:hypothetical protein [Planctomycetota bacterium]
MTSRPDSHTPSEQVRKARKRRWWVVLVVLVAAALAAAALGPTLLSTPPGAASLLGYVGSLIGGRMTADDLSLSWFGRQEVSGLDARTDEGAPVAAVRYCSLDAGLLNLLWTGRIGAVTVRDADVYVEGLCQLKPPESAKPPPRKADEAAEAPTLPLSVEIRGLKLHAKEATVHLEQATFNTAPAGDTLEASLKVARGADEGRGSVTARIEGLSSDFRGWDAIGVRGAVKAESLPLAALFDILAAAGVPAQGGGTLAGSADAARERSGAVNVQTQWVGQDVWLSGDILRGDKLAMGRVDLSARLSLRGDTVEVDSLRLESPVVAAQAQGTFVLPTGEGAKAGAAKASGTGRLAADLAALARMLPATLGLHKDLQIESGRLEATVAASHEAAAAADVLRIAADIKDFGGRRVGRPVALQPVHLDAEISDDAQGLAVRNLLATGSFGRVEGSGRTSALTLTVSIALDKAVADVGQFIDLGGRSASGNLKATLKTRGPPAGRQGGGPAGPVSLDLAAEATDLALVLAPYSRWHERRATLAAQAEIAMDAQGAPVQATVSSLRLSGAAGEAAGQGTLRFQPAGWTADGAITGQGEVAALAAQVAGLTGGKPTDASGQWSLQAQARGGLDTGLDMKLRADVRNLAYAPPAAGEPTPAGAPAKSSGAAGATDVPAPPAGVAGPAGPAGPVAAGAAPGPGAASAAGASASAGPARAPVAVGDLSAAADVRVASRQSGLDVSVHQLDITGPGLTGRVAGEVSVPASQPAGKSSSVLTIAGQGDLRVELAQASGVLRAMGLVAPGSRLAGAVTAQARAEQKAGGLAGAVK